MPECRVCGVALAPDESWLCRGCYAWVYDETEDEVDITERDSAPHRDQVSTARDGAHYGSSGAAS